MKHENKTFTNVRKGLRLMQQCYFEISNICYVLGNSLNAIQDGGGGQKGPSTSFSPVTSTNVGSSP